MNRYDVKSILESNSLPIGGGAAKRLKEAQALETSRKREEMLALSNSSTASFQYGNGSSSTSSRNLLGYPLFQHQFDQQPQPLLTLQNHDISQYDTTSSFHQSYIQTQLQLHQQQSGQFYNGNNNYVQNHQGLFQGLMDNNGGSYSGGYMGNNDNISGIGMGSGNDNAVGSTEEVALVKVDYDMPSGGYGGWSAPDSMQQHGSNATNVFTMWND